MFGFEMFFGFPEPEDDGMSVEEELRMRLNAEECARCPFMQGTCDWSRPMPNGHIYIPPCFIPDEDGGDDDGSP